jgi:phage replication initiation protein
MTGSGGFTQTIDWLAFTLPKAEVADVITLIGGDWFQSETGFRGYPVAQLMTQGKTGVGKLGTGAPRNPKEVHVDLSAGIVSQWDETKLKTVLAWIFAQKGHVTRIDVALDDREATVAVETVRQAVEAGQVVSRSKQFKVIQASNHRQGVRTGETLYFGSRESQSMLRVYDKRLELQSRGREDAASYGVRWEMEFKQDRAQACAKALLTLDPKIGGPSWSGCCVPMWISERPRERPNRMRSIGRPLVAWWEGLTEGFRRCRLVVERIQQRLDDVVAWFANALSPMLAVVVACRGDQFLMEMIYAGTKRWNQKHYALLKQRKKVVTPYVLHLKPRSMTTCTSAPVQECKAAGAWGEFRKGKLFVICTTCRFGISVAAESPACGPGRVGQAQS